MQVQNLSIKLTMNAELFLIIILIVGIIIQSARAYTLRDRNRNKANKIMHMIVSNAELITRAQEAEQLARGFKVEVDHLFKTVCNLDAKLEYKEQQNQILIDKNNRLVIQNRDNEKLKTNHESK